MKVLREGNMFYTTTKEHEEFRKKVREFAEKEVKPIAFELDQNSQFPDEVVKKMGELGFMGIPYAKEYGGAGLDVISYAICVEELSRVDGGVGVIVSAHTSLGSYPISAFGTEEQKKKYLVPLAKGEHIGAFGLTEPNAGSDAGGTETTAVLDGDYYILNGGKIFITNAGKADTYIIFAVTTPNIGTKGISAFIVEAGYEGFDASMHYDKLGIRSSITSELSFNNVKVPKENLLGKEGEGFRIAMMTLDGGRIGIASQALGIAQGAYESALGYAKQRVQFGKPISALESIQFKFAEMATKLRAARLLIYSAAELKQNHEDYSVEAAMAKKFASDKALEITNDALQIYGGSGFIKGIDVERFYRDAKITTIYEGTNEIMNVVIASHIVGRPPKKAKKSASIIAAAAPKPITGIRKGKIFKDGNIEEQVHELVESLRKDGHDFSLGIDINTPITESSRVVSAGRGIGPKENMKLAEDLAKAVGASIGASRPVAETQKYLPLNRYVGMSGQTFKGNLYIALGISGAVQHLKGIKNAATIVAINKNGNAPIFKNADYGIVGDINEVVPALIKELGGADAPKHEGEMKKIRRAKPEKLTPSYKSYACNGCGYEYNPMEGDPVGDIAPGTEFKNIPDEWICPDCGESKEGFIEVAYKYAK